MMVNLLALVTLSRSAQIDVLDRSKLSDAEQMLVESIQGLANRRSARVWIRSGGIGDVILAGLRGVRNVQDPWLEASRFRANIRNVIEFKLGTASLNVATSLCGPMHGIAVDESLVAAAKAHGFPVTLNVVGESEQQAFSKGPQSWRHGIAVEQLVSKPGFLRDFAIAHDAFTMDTVDSGFRMLVIRSCGPTPLVFGWSRSENGWVSDVTEAGGTAVAADWCSNLSALEHIRARVPQPPRQKPVATKANTRYIAFVLTDGDNLQWLTSGFALDPKFFGSKWRGAFPMTWEVSPLLGKYAPSVLAYLYSHATPNDDFVSGAGLPGYMYPSISPDRSALAKQTAGFMRESRLRIASFIDQDSGHMSSVAPWLATPAASAGIYKEFDPYDGKHGKLVWQHGKPVMAYRFMIWEGHESVGAVAREIHSMPTDPSLAGSYALVSVHAWSYGSQGGPIEAVHRLLGMLGPHTKVVTATQLFGLLIQNHPTSHRAPP